MKGADNVDGHFIKGSERDAWNQDVFRRSIVDRGWARVCRPIVCLRPGRAAETPSQFVASLGNSAIHTMGDGGLTDEERIRKFRKLLVDRFDLPLIGRYVLGVHWLRASPEQRIEFAGLFEEYLVSIYASALSQYGGESLSVKSTHAAGKDTIVTTEVHGPRIPTLKVDWRIRGDTDNYKVVDIIVEGVSLVIIQRDQFTYGDSSHRRRRRRSARGAPQEIPSGVRPNAVL